MDPNELRRLLDLGYKPEDFGLSVDQLTGTMTEPAPQGNALKQMIEQAQGNITVGPQDFSPSGQSIPRINDMEGREYAPPGGKTKFGFTDDPALAAQNDWTLIGQNKKQGQAQGQAQGMTGRPLRVIGAGGDATVELAPEVAPAQFNIDYSQPPIEIAGVGKVYRSKDAPYIGYTLDGNKPTAKVILGYNDAGSRARNKEALAAESTRANIAQSQASTEHTQEATRASKVNNPEMGMGGANPLATGDAALAGVDPGTAGIVKQMVEGRMAPPGQFALRSPRIMNLLALANQYDPSFDATAWAERYKTAQGFSAGKQGDAVRAVNQTVSHMGDLSDAITKLDNFNGIATPLNYVVNPVESLLGDPRQGVFKQKVQAVSSELRKVFASGGNSGGLAELQQWESSFPLNASKEQQETYLRSGVSLLNGAIGALKDQYERGMGPKGNFGNLITSKAQSTLERLQGGAPESQQAAPSIPPAAVDFLRRNPAAAADFDRKYGQGAAQRAMGR